MIETLEIVVEESILPDDREALAGKVSEITALILQNPFADRIWSLLLNPQLATEPVMNTMGQMSKPNCIGTALFVAGVSQLGYPYHAYETALNEGMKHKLLRPGLDPLMAEIFSCPPDEIPLGAFCFSFFVQSDDWHAGIYLGKVDGEDILFAQHGHGGPFCVETLRRNHSGPSFYLPQTLVSP